MFVLKHLYTYDGSVYILDRMVERKWHGETWAQSEAKAKNNLKQQYKSSNGYASCCKVELPDKVTMHA